MEPRYRIRFRFEWGGGCLWAADDETKAALGYEIDYARLPLEVATREWLVRIDRWHDKSLNWDYPPDPGPWPSM